MHEPFRQAVQMCLPLARIVVDKFHLIRHINGALDKIRSRLQGGSQKGKRRDLFKSRYTLVKGVERLADWERKIRDIERLGATIYGRAKGENPGSSRNYLQTALWAAFKTSTGEKIKRKYELIEDKGIAFYGHVIGNLPPEALNNVENEHWEAIKKISKYKEMTELIEIRKEAETLQKRVSDLIDKALLSSDIFYPCKFCRRLMKA